MLFSYTEDGYDEYFIKHPNPNYWLHFQTRDQMDAQIQELKDELVRNGTATKSHWKYNSTKKWSYQNYSTNQTAVYLVPEGEMLQPENLEALNTAMIAAQKEAAEITMGRMNNPRINPNDELYLKIITQY